LELAKQKEEKQLAVQKQLQEMEKRSMNVGKDMNSKLYPATYYPPEPKNQKLPNKTHLPTMQHNEWGFGVHQ